MKTIAYDETQWQLVPKEPNHAMTSAGMNAWTDSWSDPDVVYLAMLAAAPQPPDECDYCGSRGEVSGFLNSESGYESMACPSCSQKPPAVDDDPWDTGELGRSEQHVGVVDKDARRVAYYELDGVITDAEKNGFDGAFMETLKRVQTLLASAERK